MANVVWTPAAEEDLESIFLGIGREQRSPAAAARVIHAVVDKTLTYAAQPLLAAARPEFGPLIRSFSIHRYVVIYRPAALGIEVIRVIHVFARCV
jgi:plasmid stabilization system protein ParE